ncbi:Hypothetical predicted protein [Mytilus galloprovincialis]|uniref:Uncharacterized protein n=1 Tax=Mytilus galloprovincialis TaxID=29158 RepID=A0A8B6DMF8_MYTGA|nr:Hypothetical predicted protein [Mytilus galloprovincialis]
MQTGLISFAAFFLGGGLMSYWWTPHYTNTTYVLSHNITQSSIVMENVTQKLLQCQANLTAIKQDFNNVQENFVYFKKEVTESFTGLKSEVSNVNNGITGTIEGVKEEMKEDYLLLKRDLQILTGTKQIHDNNFNEEIKDLHHRIITSVFQQEEVEIKPFLLEKTDPDGKDIPRCQFIFVFVDFNKTNVILENPGDKRLVTVQACMKMIADVFVIYTRDRDSSHLGDGTLYNKDLSAFTGHFLLKELTAKNRGLSVNDTFTQYQKSHIRKIVLEK